MILGWRAVFFTLKCLRLGADRTFDKPYPPRPKAFLRVNDQGWPITGESPRLGGQVAAGRARAARAATSMTAAVARNAT